jgi:hypothetical protein
MHQEHIEIPTAVAAIIMMVPAFTALGAIVFGVCFSFGLPAVVPAAVMALSGAGVRIQMKKEGSRIRA